MAPAKKKATSSNALEFVFSANALQRILDFKPDKVVFTVSVSPEVSKTGEKLGALRFKADGYRKGKKITPDDRDNPPPGCPIPPCVH